MAVIRIRVLPRASRNEVAGCLEGVWKVRLTAPPVEGKANAALVALLSERLGVSKGDVSILRGQSGREKLVEITGLGDEDVARRLGSEDAGR